MFRILGSGYEGPEEKDIPIDIQAHKLLEWVVDRKKVPKNWKPTYDRIKAKIDAARSELPKDNNEIEEFVKDRPDLTYYDAMEIMNILKRTVEDAESKTLFGGYKVKSLKDWDEIIKAFNSNNVYLADAAQILVQIALYEIPGLKKAIERAQKQITEYNHKDSEQVKAIQTYKTQFNQACAEFGIEGKDIKAELVKSASDELPKLFDKISSLTQKIETSEAIKYYDAFMKINRGENTVNTAEEDLATLIYVQSHGNDSLINYKKNTNLGIELVDSSANNAQNNANNSSANTGAIEINWGDFDLGTGSSNTPTASTEVTPAEIPVESAPLEIKWDIDVSGSGSAAANDSDISNFEITIENEGESSITSDEFTVSGGQEFNSAPVSSSESILANSTVRNKFLDSLFELDSFLSQRLAELKVEEKSNTTPIIAINNSDEGKIVQQYNSSEAVQKLLSHVQSILQVIDGEKFKQFLEISHSKRFVDRLGESITSKLEVSNKLQIGRTELQRKKDELETSIKANANNMEKLKKRVVTLKSNIEQSISKLFNGRPVNIIGDLNKF
jgi:hypothetical protein